MVTRRKIIIALGLGPLATSYATVAQQVGRIPSVGVLWHAGSAEEEGPFFRALNEGFNNLGYVDGRNIILEHRFPNEIPERFKSLAAELVSLKVDVLVGVGVATSSVVKNATTTIPVVFVFAPDPVGTKLVDSLARPGGNVTGLTTLSDGLIGKRLQYLKEAISGLSRVAFLVSPGTAISRVFIDEAQAAAAKIGLNVEAVEVRALDDLAPAFDAMVKARTQAVIAAGGGVFFQGRALIAKLALAHRLPTCFHNAEFAEAGALISYGPDQRAMARRAATYVDKILKGANPGNIPVEQPTTFELVINMKTAKALGIKFPNSILVQATKVIE